MPDLTLDRYEAICDASPDAIILVDGDGRITYANPRVTDLFGYDPAELVGEPVERLVPEPLQDEHVARRDSYLDDPDTRPMGADIDLEARCKDGSTIPVDISLSPIESGEGLEVMAVVREIRERETLRTKYQTILEAVPDAVVIADAETGEIVETNDRVEALFGYSPEDLVGEDQSALHPSGEGERYRGLFDHHVDEGQAIFTQLPDGSDIHVETRDGERIPVEINARVFELAGRQRIAGVFRDITARKEREQQLRDLTETTRKLIEASDAADVASRIATAANTILGHPRTIVRVRNDGELRPVAVTDQARLEMGPRPNYPIDGENPVSRAYRRGEVVHYADVRDVSDEYDRGEARSVMYLPLGEHGVMGIADTETDAFDRSDVELASTLAANAETAFDRLDAKRELERQNERLEEFARIVSHDLRNPLNAADGWLDVARDGGSTDALDRVENALDRMDAIIDDTLTLARQGRTVGDLEVIEVGELAEACWNVVSTANAELEIADDIRVRADRERLRHVLENLFRNAVAHGGDDVTITIGSLDEEGFYVADDGPGIPEDDRDTVFEPGYTTAPDGTGFGLAIVKRVVEAHGWDVRIADAADGGARFEFLVSDR